MQLFIQVCCVFYENLGEVEQVENTFFYVSYTNWKTKTFYCLLLWFVFSFTCVSIDSRGTEILIVVKLNIDLQNWITFKIIGQITVRWMGKSAVEATVGFLLCWSFPGIFFFVFASLLNMIGWFKATGLEYYSQNTSQYGWSNLRLVH